MKLLCRDEYPVAAEQYSNLSDTLRGLGCNLQSEACFTRLRWRETAPLQYEGRLFKFYLTALKDSDWYHIRLYTENFDTYFKEISGLNFRQCEDEMIAFVQELLESFTSVDQIKEITKIPVREVTNLFDPKFFEDLQICCSNEPIR